MPIDHPMYVAAIMVEWSLFRGTWGLVQGIWVVLAVSGWLSLMISDWMQRLLDHTRTQGLSLGYVLFPAKKVPWALCGC